MPEHDDVHDVFSKAFDRSVMAMAAGAGGRPIGVSEADMIDRIAPGLASLLLLLGCAAATEWVRSGQSAEANRRDYAACEEVAAVYYKQPLAAERAEGYGGGVPSPLRGAYPPARFSEVPDLPLRAGRGDLVNREDASRRLDRERDRRRAINNRDIALRNCLVAAGFEERPISHRAERTEDGYGGAAPPQERSKR